MYQGDICLSAFTSQCTDGVLCNAYGISPILLMDNALNFLVCKLHFSISIQFKKSRNTFSIHIENCKLKAFQLRFTYMT